MDILSDKSIVTFTAKDSKAIATVLGLDEIMRGPKTPHGAIFQFDAKVAQEFEFFELGFVSLAYLEPERRTIVAMDEEGEVRLLDGDGVEAEYFAPPRGPMRCLKRIDDTLFAGGVSAQVFVRDAPGSWRDISPPQSPHDHLRLSMIESIDGYSKSEIYAAADNGVIWYYDGETWHAVETATNLAFYAIHCGSDGVVYAVGQMGILARGRGQEFEILPDDQEKADFWGVAYYEGTLYASSMRALMHLDDDNFFVPDVEAMDVGFTFYSLEVVDDVLWSVGEKHILARQGGAWSGFVNPEWVQ